MKSSTAPGDAPRSLQPRWVLPVAGPPLENAAVTIAAGRIVALGSPPKDVPVEDLGNVALVPGLVNAHTHLEFSDLAQPIGQQGMNFVDWLWSVIAYRETARPEVNATSSIALGLAESIRCGVTTIGEIAQRGSPTETYDASPCDVTLFLELIAPRLERVEAVLTAAREHLQRAKLPSPSGLSASCTVHGPSAVARQGRVAGQ